MSNLNSDLSTPTSLPLSNSTSDSYGGFFSWIYNIVSANSEETSTEKHENKIDSSLPKLPFNYDPTKTHLVLIKGTFGDLIYGWTVIMVSDLDIQMLNYVSKQPETYISTPSLEDYNEDEDSPQSTVLRLSTFVKEHIKVLSSDCPMFKEITEFLEVKDLYESIGSMDSVQWWYDNIYSLNPPTTKYLEDLMYMIWSHGKHYYPDYMENHVYKFHSE